MRPSTFNPQLAGVPIATPPQVCHHAHRRYILNDARFTRERDEYHEAEDTARPGSWHESALVARVLTPTRCRLLTRGRVAHAAPDRSHSRRRALARRGRGALPARRASPHRRMTN